MDLLFVDDDDEMLASCSLENCQISTFIDRALIDLSLPSLFLAFRIALVGRNDFEVPTAYGFF